MCSQSSLQGEQCADLLLLYDPTWRKKRIIAAGDPLVKSAVPIKGSKQVQFGTGAIYIKPS